uniref:DNA-directed RNA polymerase n=1 Tax=Nephromyces sp. ex Molgula occidentalis TaxID=2544991 RepID=A0A5C1H7X0_9APIC|nr:plastid-encoded DNA-directed RNA polymerase beta''A [Nephromyces sp. ex Molgula occidentalis]
MNFQFLTKTYTPSHLDTQYLKYFDFYSVSNFLHELMFLGFNYTLKYSISLNLESFKHYFYLSPLFRKYNNVTLTYLWNYATTSISTIKINENSSTTFKKFFEIIELYKQTNTVINSLNLMVSTGAKASWSQLLQLIGFRGYLSNTKGHLYEIPIMQNFSKGLELYEYFISCYGARKGIIDSAIKTADSGYLTRRLIESIRDISIKEYFCGTKSWLTYYYSINTSGRLTMNNDFLTKKYLKNTSKFNKKSFYSTSTCISGRSICNICYGKFFTLKQNNLGESIGILAAQTIGEPGTQLTLRTFHTGGVFTNVSSSLNFKSKVNLNLFNIWKYKLLTFKKHFSKLPLTTKFDTSLIGNFNIPGTLKFNLNFKDNFNSYYTNMLSNIINYKTIYNWIKNIHIKSCYIKSFSAKQKYLQNQLLPFWILNQLSENFDSKNNIKNSFKFQNSREIINYKTIYILLKNANNKWILKNLNTNMIYYKPFLTHYLSTTDKIIIKNFNNYFKLITVRTSIISKLKFCHLFNRYLIFKTTLNTPYMYNLKLS